MGLPQLTVNPGAGATVNMPPPAPAKTADSVSFAPTSIRPMALRSPDSPSSRGRPTF